jgi:single-stranded-DNA-specific exonuclease
MPLSKHWNIAQTQEGAAELAARLKISSIVAQVLLNRGISLEEDARAFLRPSLMTLANPALIPGLNAASQRIAQAIRDKQKIVIYGDYDVDGITATAILWHAITLLGGRVQSYIPHRIEEGYGVNAEALRQIIDAGAQLIITVDCGITAIEQAKVAAERAVDLIITDHHEWHGDPPQLPQCHTIVHPRLPGESADVYPNPFLCGAGVAFKLAWGIGQAVSGGAKVGDQFREFLIEATALAALGTIADVVPLVGENRVLAHFGLGGLKESKLTGIRALIASAALTGQKLDSYHVGFLLAPRLNACGRMGHADLAVEMLTTAGETRANEIAVYLESQNRARQAMEKQILNQAIDQIQSNGWAEDRYRALVLGAEGWHAGVIGIVASRLVDRYCRPAIMVALSNGHGQGSGRSVAGFHLSRALAACGQHLTAYGGHEMAAGLKIETPRLDDFRKSFQDYAQSAVSDEMLIPRLNLECIAQIPQINEALVNDLHRIGPFGHRNPRPLLCIQRATIAGLSKRVGKAGEHLQLTVQQAGRSMRCIAFQFGDTVDRLPPGANVDLAVEPMINEFNGRFSVELNVKDLKVSAG